MAAKLWWVIHKDLLSECRARQVWPAMLLLGTVVAFVFAIHADLPAAQRHRVIGGLLWVAVFLAGTLALDRSFTSEHDENCIEALLLYPISAMTIYLAKMMVNVVALACLECVLIPLFIVLSDAPLLDHPWAMLLVAMLGNIGVASVGTLLSAFTSGIRNRASLLALLALPLVLPVVLGAAEATRLMTAERLGAEWLRWVQLLAAFAVIFVTAGAVLFEFVVEE